MMAQTTGMGLVNGEDTRANAEARRGRRGLSSAFWMTATFRTVMGSLRMKTFLKVVLLVIVALVALKLLPMIFAFGCLLAAAIVAVLALGGSAIATLFGAMIALAVVLAPIWVPVLALVGLIALIKRGTRNSRVAAV